MNLHLLLFVLFVGVACHPGRRLMGERQKKNLTREWHDMDIDRRAQRLRRLEADQSMEQTKEKTKEMERRLKIISFEAIRRVKTETPEVAGGSVADMFEVNEEIGVDEYLFQGDIQLSEAQLAAMEAGSSSRSKRQATTVYPKWTGGILNYYLDDDLTERKRIVIGQALEYMQQRTCIQFHENKTATNRVVVFNGGGCYSTIAMIGGEQLLSIGDGCEVIGTVAHEFTHALGIWHQQMRPDRDDYVTIATDNVDPDKLGNFRKLAESSQISSTPYEYGSFMQYPANAFSINKSISIVPTDTSYTYTMGNRQISFYDMLMVNNFYACHVKCATSKRKCQNGGYPNPANCTICNCPVGYGGKLCNERPSGCGESLTATTIWQSKQFSFGNTTSKTTRDTFATCNHWVKAPAGSKVQVKITEMYNGQCRFGCGLNGIEIKTHSDQKMAPAGSKVQVKITEMYNGQCRFGCGLNGIEIKTHSDQKMVSPSENECPEFLNQEFSSTIVPTSIVSYNRNSYSTFTIQYRYV